MYRAGMPTRMVECVHNKPSRPLVCMQANPYLACSPQQSSSNTTGGSASTQGEGVSTTDVPEESSDIAAALGLERPVGRRLAQDAPPSAATGSTSTSTGVTYAGGIVLAGRGDCSFTSKAQMALQAQAAGLLIINTSPSPLLAA
jgi:hypothetical protein